MSKNQSPQLKYSGAVNGQIQRTLSKLLSNFNHEDVNLLLKLYGEQVSGNLVVRTLLGDFMVKFQEIYEESELLEINAFIQLIQALVSSKQFEKQESHSLTSTIHTFLKQFGAKFVLINEAFQQICEVMGVTYHPVFEASNSVFVTPAEAAKTTSGPISVQQLVEVLIPQSHDTIRDIIQAFVQNVNVYQNPENFRGMIEAVLHAIWAQGMQVKQFFRSARVKSLFVEIMKLHFNYDHPGFVDTTLRFHDISGCQPYAKYLLFLTKYQKSAYDVDFRHFLAANFDAERALNAPRTPIQMEPEAPSPPSPASEPSVGTKERRLPDSLVSSQQLREQEHKQPRQIKQVVQAVPMQKREKPERSSKPPPSSKPIVRFQEINVDILSQPLSNEYEVLVKEFIVRFQDMQLTQFVDEVWVLYRTFIGKNLDSETVLRFMERVLHPIWQQCLINKSRLRNGRIQEIWKALQLQTRDRFYVLMVRSNMSEMQYDGQYAGGYGATVSSSGGYQQLNGSNGHHAQ